MSDYDRKAPKSRNPWTIKQQSSKKPVNVNSNNLKNSESKFKEAKRKFQAAAEKHAKDYESSSEEEDLEAQNVIDSILKSYTSSGANADTLGRTKGYLEDAFVSGAATCLICISGIKRNDSIWNCSECYCSFHLTCIQRWSKDTIVHQKQALESQIQIRLIKLAWGCPKCRHDYKPEDVPTQYLCFCKKTVNPSFQPLMVPHSCGEKCGKELKPLCGHECVLLCHPGPCPPCPQMVSVKCYCGGKPAKPQRCSNKEWTCGSPCNKLLACGKHKCIQSCHSGECQACSKKSIQKCLCAASQKLRDCATPVWQCEKVCNKPLDCGHHNCPELCHIGDCDKCELSKLRICPCGKSSFQLPCTEETPVCGDTCGKLLECGQHICNERCHKDKCAACIEIVTKVCQCGLHTKEVPCKKPYLCETKCKRLKDCNKHPCNRKCCDGNCPPCEKPCNRTLSCGNHKCTSVCHRGPCYPCQLTEKVFCRCGETYISVPCGRKQKTRPPKCDKSCLLPPDCHHPQREKHKCHFGACPSCRQMCNKIHSTCSHSCPAPCHSAVLVKVEEKKATMPWEQTGPQYEMKDLPCPDCKVPVSVTCLGEHETCDWPCYTAKPSSCQRPCKRLLQCQNHVCVKVCHTVIGAPDKLQAGDNCETCESPCTKPRPDGCPHTCPKPCHPGACPPCKQMVRIRCHCGLNQPYVTCKDWIVPEKKEELQCCGNQCPCFYDCGHRCRSNCHLGPCPNSDMCKKKVKITCPCKRIKKEFSCETVRKGLATVDCNDECEQKREEEKKQKLLEQEEKIKQEELKNQQELKKYTKMFNGKKKNRERKFQEQIDEKSFLQRNWLFILFSFAAFISSALYFNSL